MQFFNNVLEKCAKKVKNGTEMFIQFEQAMY